MTIASQITGATLLHRGVMNSDLVRLVQRALQRAGASLIADGDFGGITEAAIKAFQAAHKIPPTGAVDAATAAALDGVASTPATDLPSALQTAPWLSTMRAITGTKELPGNADSPIILEWRDKIIDAFPELGPGVRGYTHDSIPWCGLTVAYCLAEAKQRPPLFPLYATNYFSQWEDGVRIPEPALGAILVKTRNGGGHVTLYEGEDGTYYYCRGGNQSDMVNVTRIPKVGGGVLGFMWPKRYPLPLGGRVHRTFAEAVAGSEA